MALCTRADNLLLLLYAPLLDGRFQPPFRSAAAFHRAVYLLQCDGTLWLPRHQPFLYPYAETEVGLFSSSFYDDLIALYSMGCLHLEKSPSPIDDLAVLELKWYFRGLCQGDQLLPDFEALGECTVGLSSSLGLRLGARVFRDLTVSEKRFLSDFKTQVCRPDLLIHLPSTRVGTG